MALTEIRAARAAWADALAAADVEAVVSCYSTDAMLVGTLDDAAVGPRLGSAAIRDYFRILLDPGPARVEFQTALDDSTVVEMGVRHAAHLGYYRFHPTAGETLRAKYCFVYLLSAAGVRIVAHTSGLVPAGRAR